VLLIIGRVEADEGQDKGNFAEFRLEVDPVKVPIVQGE
jgi:hypothetical protein